MSSVDEQRTLPIGFMDSGLGGLSVLREAMRIMPWEDFVYYGDSLHAPYGTKEQEEIKRLTFSVVEKLLDRGIKGLAVACNTATSAAVRFLRVEYPDLPLVGIEPAIKPAVVCNRGGEILVMATPMTIKQVKYQDLLDLYKDQASILSVPCEGLMEFVEQGKIEGPELKAYLEKHLQPYIHENTETIVLGCTHYPFLKPYLKKFLGNQDIHLLDGSLGTSLELRRRLKEKNLLYTQERERQVEILNSSKDPEMIQRSYRLLSMPFE